jgi:hypothetical protein
MEAITLSDFWKREGNIALGDADGVILFCHLHDNVYEGHYLFPDKLRGKAALQKAREIFAQLFTLYQASAIVGHVPVENFGSRVMTRALGFASEGTSADHNGCSCVNYRMERKTWAALSGVSYRPGANT